MKYAFIEQQRSHHALSVLCRVMEVSRSGYHDWRQNDNGRGARARDSDDVRPTGWSAKRSSDTRDATVPRD